MGDRLNRVAQLSILMDLTLRPDLAEAIIGHIRAFYTAYLVAFSGGGLIDIVVTGDDFGAQNGLLISPRTWRERPSRGSPVPGLIRHGARSMHHLRIGGADHPGHDRCRA